MGNRVSRRHPSSWRRLFGLAAGTILVLSMLSAGPALAANPNWKVGHGTDSFFGPQPASGASSTAISAGNKVGFFEWLRNDDTSNISQLSVTASSTPAATVAGATWSIKTAAGAVVRTGTCPTATPLNCSFGALRSGETVYIVAAFQTAGNLADGTVQNVHFEFSTTGVPGGKNNSHGDAKGIDDAATATNNGDAAGDFNLNQSDLTVADNQNVSNANPQATSASVAALLTGIAVGDSPSLVTPCDASLTVGFPSFFNCSQLTSLTSVVEVGNGKIFANANGGPGIKVVITFNKAPRQLSGSNPFVYHYWVDAAGAHAELITATCDSNSLPTNLTPCLIVGNKNVTVWLFHNGPMRS